MSRDLSNVDMAGSVDAAVSDRRFVLLMQSEDLKMGLFRDMWKDADLVAPLGEKWSDEWRQLRQIPGSLLSQRALF